MKGQTKDKTKTLKVDPSDLRMIARLLRILADYLDNLAAGKPKVEAASVPRGKAA